MEEKIFITLGSQKFQFNRLLIAVDKLCEKKIICGEDVFAQIGYSDYVPQNYRYNNFLDREEFSMEMGKADIVITHGGTGAIIGAVKKEKKVIAVPRLAKYGEHVDDHQLQLIKQFDDLNLICPCRDTDELAEAIETVKHTRYAAYESNTTTKIFVEFVAMILRCKMYTKLKEEMKNLEKKPNYMTVPAALKELEKIEMVRQLDNIYRLDHAVTANQKTILNAFGLDVNHIKYYASELSKELKKVE